ncbi:ATP-dependent DNA helicase RecG [Bowdeniella nasicola]|uniref:ATP-dependent DNA helicase RecG n=1 Tax=Bowdeniella nasicola TaxID=208480 RepID=A0A1H4CPI7_9ACTO|nr:ATP-binding protein [Bowdeniella nasicola]SEA62243.1 ATP-dependent DNA helicase RecG [Bowdeniella nasicola]
MTDAEADVRKLIQALRKIGTDTESVEVKTAARGIPKDLRATMSAFANGNGGTLILGLNEQEGFIPVQGFDAKAGADALTGIAANDLSPALRFPISIIPFEEGAVVVAKVVALPPAERPCFVTSQGKYGGSYIRSHDGNRLLTPYEIDRMSENRSQPLFDRETVIDADLSDLDGRAVANLLARLQTTKPRAVKGGREVALRRLHVIGRDTGETDHPTLAGLLALGDYPQEFFPRLNVAFAVYPGTTKADVLSGGARLLDSRSIDGSIPEMVEDTVAAVSRNMRTGGLIEGAFRKDLPDYPLEAVREAITNALMHRDYSPMSRGTPVQVDMYVDRMEIINPGGLFGNITVDSLGRAGTSSSRNASLSRLLEDVQSVDGGAVAENRGTGYAIIAEALRKALMQDPIPTDSPTHFKITMFRRRLTPAEQESKGIRSTRGAIMHALSQGKSLSSSDLIDASGLSRTTIVRHLNDLIAEGKIEATDATYSPRRRYRLVPQGSSKGERISKST